MGRRKRQGAWDDYSWWEIAKDQEDDEEDEYNNLLEGLEDVGNDDNHDNDDPFSSMVELNRVERFATCNETCECNLCLSELKGCLEIDDEFTTLSSGSCSVARRGFCSTASKMKTKGYTGIIDLNCSLFFQT